MTISDFSIWGFLLLLLLVGVAAGLVVLIDRRLVGSLLHVGKPLPRLTLRMWLPVAAGIVAGSLCAAGSVALCLAGRVFCPVLGIAVVCLLVAIPRGFDFYVRSLKHTEAHRRYLLACGATPLESLMPSVRRALRAALLPLVAWQRSSPLLVALPLLFFGLVAGGASAGAALVATLLVWMGVVAGTVAGSVLAMWLANLHKSDITLI